MINYPKVSKQSIQTFLIEDCFPFATGVIDTCGAPTLSCEYLRKFLKKIWNGHNWILRGMGETDWWKKLKSKISWLCPLTLA